MLLLVPVCCNLDVSIVSDHKRVEPTYLGLTLVVISQASRVERRLPEVASLHIWILLTHICQMETETDSSWT